MTALGEFELIRRYFDRGPSRRSVLGIGDDGALIRTRDNHELVLTVDTLVEGRHFFADVEPESLGHKALAVNLSDLAAMGAAPLGFLMAISLPRADPAWLEQFAAGLFALAEQFQCELLGGDTTRGPLQIAITALGELPAGSALQRAGAQPGDDLWVSGEIGGPAWGVAERYAGRADMVPPPVRQRIDRPVPRVDLGIELRHLASAAIDLSDGLMGDLTHIVERSRLSARIWLQALPTCQAMHTIVSAEQCLQFALAGGDDYELLFAAPAENRLAILAIGERLGLRITRIGDFCAGDGIQVLDPRGQRLNISTRSHEHFT